MILVDANLLIYAVDADSPHHSHARRWLEQRFSGSEWIGLPWLVILAFLRITTNPRVFRRPLAADRAVAYVDSWLTLSAVVPIGPGDRHWDLLASLLRQTGTAGNLTSDAHIAALSLETGATVCSADNDFKRFPGVRHINPLRD